MIDEEEIAEIWKEYFSDLLNVEDNEANLNNAPDENDVEMEENEDTITEHEVRTAIQKMKRGKSPGEDELPVEILKAGGDDTIQQLTRLFNLAYRTDVSPLDWQRGLISPIRKKGDVTVCDNYRVITLLAHTGKVYTRILDTRTRACAAELLNECQYGFIPGKSTLDPIFIVKMILEKSWEWGLDKYALFVDLEKVFDRINRNNLWSVLRDDHYNIPRKLVRVIRSMYAQCCSKVKTQGIESDHFHIGSGVRQGDVLSPLLLIIYMDKCVRDIGVGYFGEKTLIYADDVVVLADSVEDLQDISSRWLDGMSRNGMKINTRKGKTEDVVISRNPTQCEIYMEGDKLYQSECYTHLGVNVGGNNLQEVEINNRIAKYNSYVGMVYPLLRDRNIARRCKIIIYQSILKPILMYGSEVWSLTTKTESRLQAAEMRV